MNDKLDIEIVTDPLGGFWLRIGSEVYTCQLTPYKKIPIHHLD